MNKTINITVCAQAKVGKTMVIELITSMLSQYANSVNVISIDVPSEKYKEELISHAAEALHGVDIIIEERQLSREVYEN